MMQSHFLEDLAKNTPLVKLRYLNDFNNGSTNLLKLEGNNPAGSVKDRPAMNMIRSALKRGEINSKTKLIEATSGNTGIALAMVAAAHHIDLTLIMPENATEERKQAMHAFGAKLILVSEEAGMEGARDLAQEKQRKGEGVVLNQFANDDNWRAHYLSTAPEIWKQTNKKITHFVSAMGTTGTIMGCSRFLKEHNNDIQIIGVQPKEGDQIPGIRRWPPEYVPAFFDSKRVDQTLDVSTKEAIVCMKRLAKEEGIFSGVSSGGALHIALKIAQENPSAVVVSVSCDRGDRYLSSQVFDH